MSGFRTFTAAEQVAAHLRNELMRGVWSGLMPGADRVAAELGVSCGTAEEALRLLEKEGRLVNRGQRRGRQIVSPEGSKAARVLRVAILDYEPLALTEGYKVELQHLLMAAGHHAFFTGKSLLELRMDVRRVARLVRETAADGWVVAAGSREVLEWFAAQTLPVMALFGRRRGLPIAGVGPDKLPAMAAAVRRLVDLGHRRVVLLTRKARRLPEPGAFERVFLGELQDHGVAVGPYHLPDWDETTEGFHRLLDSLFQVTPPTALLIDEATFFFATQQFLLERGLRVPQDVSLVCTDGNPAFVWFEPSVAHIHWNPQPVVRRTLRWAANISRGRRDVRQTFTKAEFIAGGTIGPAAKE